MALDDSGNIYVTWTGWTGSQWGNIIERSSDRGASWTRSEYTGTELSRTPRGIAVDHAGNVWLLWISIDSEFSPYYLNLSKSTNRGQTFTTTFRSRAFAGGFLYQKLAVDRDNSIYMLWDDVQFKLTRFRHGDATQRTDAIVPHSGYSIDAYPDLLVSSDFVVHCVWEGQTPPLGISSTQHQLIQGHHYFQA